ncbi:hypothetical protein D3C76_1839510 [compost metagenome]
MAEAAETLISKSRGVRREMNKALSDYYRALSVPVPAATEKGEESNNIEVTV